MLNVFVIAAIAQIVGTGAVVVFMFVGVLVGIVVAYQLGLAIAAVFYRPAAASRDSSDREMPFLFVVVPAHDETDSIAECVRSLRHQSYDRSLFQVVVVADNCTDDTADVAHRAGARVLVRHEPEKRGKGQALSWAFERVLDGSTPDAVVIVDADTVADEGFLAALVRPYSAGAEVVQGESLLDEDGSANGALRAAAFLLVNHVRPKGRAVLGLPSNLAGNGTLISRAVLEANPWDAFTGAEDVEYSVKLRNAGIRAVFGAGAILRTPGPPTSEAAESQRLRWEGGKLHVARTQIPSLVARGVTERRPMLLDAAVELAIPPLSLLAFAAALGTAVGAVLVLVGVVPAWSLTPWLLSLLGLPAYVLLGLRVSRAPASAYRSLAHAPLLALRKTITSYRLLRFRPESWVRTERARDTTSAR